LFCNIAVPGRADPLREARQLSGYPSVAWLDGAGDVVMPVPYQDRTVAGFRRSLARAQEYVRLRAASADGDTEATVRFLHMQLQEHQVDHATALRRRAALETDDAELLAAIDQLLVDLGIGEEIRAAGQQGRHRLGPRFLAMLEDGPRPSPQVSRGFWYAILEWAERERDAAAFRRGLDAFRTALRTTDPDAPWVGPLLARYEAQLRELER
jgi:hypothetical protein